MAMMNKKLYPELETVCFMARVEYQFLSSSLLKEVASLGGNIDDLVPKHGGFSLEKEVPGQSITLSSQPMNLLSVVQGVNRI